MTKEVLIVITAIAAITILGITAMCNGLNGSIIATSTNLIAGAAGFGLAKKTNPKS